MYGENFECDPQAARDGIAFVNPIHNGFVYARRAMESFFKYTPGELNPICITVDDCSPSYEKQNWRDYYEGMPRERCEHFHYTVGDGLTRSWNHGLRRAIAVGCRYAIAGNNDVLLNEGWYEGLMHQLDRGGARLVGPVTNAPGFTDNRSQRQHVRNFYPEYQVSDDADDRLKVARYLRANYSLDRLERVDPNGFFTMSRTDFWQEGAFSAENVFDPKFKLTGNEDELTRRWKRRGWLCGFVPASFVFHYRAVTRGDRYKSEGWTRLTHADKPV